jgi:hypothetical protein
VEQQEQTDDMQVDALAAEFESENESSDESTNQEEITLNADEIKLSAKTTAKLASIPASVRASSVR